MSQFSPSEVPDTVSAADSSVLRLIVEEVTGTPLGAGDASRTLADLGVDSFGALAVRRGIAERLGVRLELVHLLGSVTLGELEAEVARSEETRSEEARSDGGGVDGESMRVDESDTTGADLRDGALTAVQAAYWTGRGDDFELGGVASWWYHEYECEPTGDVDTWLDGIERAWRRVVAHHPMLRTVIGRDGRQHVAVHDVRSWQMPRMDWRNRQSDEAREALVALGAERSHQRRPSDVWPLFDITAVILPADAEGTARVRLLVGFDVLVIDFASWCLVMRQWGEMVDHPERDLPRAPGFAEVLADRAESEEHRAIVVRDAQWWAQRDLPHGPTLPVDRIGDRFTREQRRLPAGVWAALQERAAEHGVSPTAVVLATFALMLDRVRRGEGGFSVNLTLYDRPEGVEAIESVVGDFTTAGILSVPTEPTRRDFAVLAREVNARLWESVEHRAHAGMLERRRRASGADTDVATDPVVFTSGIGGPDPSVDRWLGERAFGVSQTPQVILDHLVWVEEGELVLTWDHRTGSWPTGFWDLFTQGELNALTRLSGAEDWGRPGLLWDPLAADHGVVPRGEGGPLLVDPWRETCADGRGAVALWSGGQSLGHDDLMARACDVASMLVERGIGPGDLVMVACPRGVAQIVAVLGIELAGAGYVPVDTQWPAVRLASVQRRSGLGWAICCETDDVELPESVGRIDLDSDGRPVAPASDPRVFDQASTPRADELAYAIFTSGSTGEPKGVAIEHQQARTTIDDVNERFAIGADDVVLGVSALSFDLSVHDIFGTLGSGGTLVLPDVDRARDPEHWLELMGRHGVTVWNSAPPLLEMLVEYAEFAPGAAEALASLRVVMLSGDWIPVSLPDRLRALAPQVSVNSLGGATEGSIWSITYPIGEVDPAWPSIPYGRGLREQWFHILDSEGWPVRVGEVGELWIGGNGVAQGYVGDPEKTAERFVVHPVLQERLYRTGDVGRWRPDGNIEFLGRTDRQVKVRGHRIELGEVEAGLLRTPGVRSAVALAMPGPDERPRLVAHVVPAPGAEVDERELARRLSAELPEYMVPTRILLHDGLPTTENGKIDVKALPNPYRGARGARSVEKVAETPAWQKVLAELIGVESEERIEPGGWPERTLVDCGVTSLGLVRLANAMEDAGLPRPRFAELMGGTTVAQLVARHTPSSRPAAQDRTSSPQPMAEPSSRERRSSVGKASPERAVTTEPVAVEPAAEIHDDGDSLADRLRILADRLERLDAELAATRAALSGVATLGAPAGSESAAISDAAPTPGGVAESVSAVPQEAMSDADEWPLTEMQLAYLVGRAPDASGVAVAPHYYTEALVSDLDAERLQRALDTLVERHPMLRTVVTETSTHRLDPDAGWTLETADHRHLDREAQLGERDRIRAERDHRLLPVDRAPMMRLLAVRLDERFWRLHLDLDLLFCDASSAHLVISELATLMRGGRLDVRRPGNPFAQWCREREGVDRTAAREYWRARAASMPLDPPVSLGPGDGRFRRRRLELTPRRWAEVRAEARAAGLTPTAWIADALGQAVDASAGFPVVLTTTERPEGWTDVVGDFSGTMLLAIDPTAPETERRAALREQYWSGLEHASGASGVHGNEVLRMLRDRDADVRLPIVISSALGGVRGDASQLLDALGTTEYAISQTPGVLLDVQLFESDGSLVVVWDAVSSAFPAGWLESRFARFTELLHGRSTAVGIGDAMEQILGELLGAPIDRAASFFELGATSLQLVTAHRRLREAGFDIGVVDVFAHPSVAALEAQHGGTHPKREHTGTLRAGEGGSAPEPRADRAHDPLERARRRGRRRAQVVRERG